MLRIPIFNGLSRKQILQMAGKTHLHFIRYTPGQTVAKAGEPCESMFILHKGSVRVTMTRGSFTLSYTLTGPDVLFANILFGLHTSFPAGIRAMDDVSVVTIPKHEYLRLLTTDDIYMYNLLNALSASSQRAYGIPAMDPFGDTRDTLKSLIYALTPRTATDIKAAVRTKDSTIVVEIKNCSRLTPPTSE